MPSGKVPVTCHACGARYLLPEGAVNGRRFRVSCRHCGQMIVGRHDGGAVQILDGEDDSHGGQTASGKQQRSAGRRRAHTGPWYLAVGGRPHGPLSWEEVVQQHQQGLITGDTYAWRLGEPRWTRVADLVSDEVVTRAGDSLSAGETPLFSDADEADQPTTFRVVGRAKAATNALRTMDDEDRAWSEPAPDAGHARSTTNVSVESADAALTRLHARARAGHSASYRLRNIVSEADSWAPSQDSARGAELAGLVAADESGTMIYSGPARGGVAAVAQKAALWSAPAARQDDVDMPLRRAATAESGPAFDPVPQDEASQTPYRDRVGSYESGKLSLRLLEAVPKRRWADEDDPSQLIRLVAPPLPAAGRVHAAPPLLLPVARRVWTGKRVAILTGSLVAFAVLVSISIVLALKPAQEPPAPAPASTAVAHAHPPTTAPKAERQQRLRSSATPDHVAPAKRKARVASASKGTSSPKQRKRARKRVVRQPKPHRSRSRPMRAPPVAVSQPKREKQQRVVRSEPAVVVDPPSAAQAQVDVDELLAVGSGRSSQPTAVQRGLSRQQIEQAMQRLRPSVQSCFDRNGDAGELRMRITVQPYGQARGKALGALAGTATARCAQQALRAVRFPHFSGKAVTFNYAWNLH